LDGCKLLSVAIGVNKTLKILELQNNGIDAGALRFLKEGLSLRDLFVGVFILSFS
jgi:hypothetical protein